MPPPTFLLQAPPDRSHRALKHANLQEEHQKRERASAGHTATPSIGPSGRQRGKTEKECVVKEHCTIDDWSEEALLRVDLGKELDHFTTAELHVKFSILTSRNHDIWALDLQRFLEFRGIFCIVTGDLPKSRDCRDNVRRWVKMDRWIGILINGNVEETPKVYLNHLKNSKAMWDELKRVHGVRGDIKQN